MSARFGERDFVDQPTGYSRGGDGVIRHTTLLDDENDDGDLWERSTDSLYVLMKTIEGQLNATAAASCHTKDIRALYGFKLTAEKLNDELEAVLRELDRRGELLSPIVSNHFWS